jgi:hypothetical protein
LLAEMIFHPDEGARFELRSFPLKVSLDLWAEGFRRKSFGKWVGARGQRA